MRRFIPVLAVLVLISTCVKARADESKIDCQMVRAKVAEHGRAVAFAWAIRNGYSWRQIKIGRACLAKS